MRQVSVLGQPEQDAADPAVAKVVDYSQLVANTWTLVHVEDNSGGKWGARVIHAPGKDRLYLWGIGGKQPERNRYLRYELESFDPLKAAWVEALPAGKADAWSDGKHPPRGNRPPSVRSSILLRSTASGVVLKISTHGLRPSSGFGESSENASSGVPRIWPRHGTARTRRAINIM